MRKAIATLAAMSLVLFGLAAPAGADSNARPFKGAMSGEVTWSLDFDCMLALSTDSTAAGNASHLGRMTMTSRHCTPAGHDLTDGKMTFIAANGDAVDLEYWGYTPTVDELVPGQVFTVDLEFLVAGGTGRFESAVGAGEMTAFVLFEDLSAPVVAASWVWSGTIGY